MSLEKEKYKIFSNDLSSNNLLMIGWFFKKAFLQNQNPGSFKTHSEHTLEILRILIHKLVLIFLKFTFYLFIAAMETPEQFVEFVQG